MIRNYFKTAFRSLYRSKYYTGIHVIGLGVAIASAMFIYRYITFHLSYDAYHQNAANTYKIVSDLHLEETSYNEGVSYAIYHALKDKVTGVDRAVFSMRRKKLNVSSEGQNFVMENEAVFASPGWFGLLDYKWISGTPDALERPHTAVLTTSAARIFFGKEDPMGKILTIEKNVPVEIVGIIDDEPSNTSLKNSIFISESSIRSVLPGIDDEFFTQWGYLMGSNEVFVSLTETTSPTIIENTLNSITIEQMGEETGRKYSFKLLLLKELHFDKRYGGTVQKSLLVTLGIIGGAILLMALLNYINLSLAQYARRSAEIGTRRVLGSNRGQLFSQFMVESLVLSGVATLVAMALLFAAFPLANTYLFLNEPLTPYPVVQWAMAGVVSWWVTGLLAGMYPSWMIVRLQILPALKQQVSFGTSAGRKVMVIIQNTFSQSLILATVIMLVQVHFLRFTDVGFNRESVLMLPLSGDMQNHWKTFLQTQPGVSSYSFCFRSPANHDQRGGTLLYDQRRDWESWPAKSTFADSAYLETFGIRLLAGRNLRTDATVAEYLVNETMARQLGAGHAQEVIGKSLLYGGMYNDKPGVIVGVVGDYNTRSLHEPIPPTVIGYHSDMMQSIAIKVDSRQMAAFIDRLGREWKARYPDQLFTYQFVDTQIDQLYASERVQQRLVWVASAMAVIIGCLGLLGLISLSVVQRTKEIGIRKVLGASVSHIVAMLAKDFVRLVLIALVISGSFAGWAMKKWLENFAYRVDIEWWMFAVAGLAAVTIALLTVSYQAIRAAVANPVNALRSE